MPDSVVKPIWKFSWRPEGYGIKDITLDTSSKKVGELISLERSYFRGREFSAELSSGQALTIGFEDQLLKGDEDLVLRLFDAKLSSLGNSGIYRMIQLNSRRTINASIKVKVNFIADAIDPEDLGQSLNQEADVIHKSLTTDSLYSKTAEIQSLKVAKSFSGDWGTLDDKGIQLSGTTVVAGKDIYGEGSIKTPEAFKVECGEGKLQYNSKDRTWEVWNPRAKTMVPLIVSHNSTENIPPGSIPIVHGSDLPANSYVDWFKVDYASQKLLVPTLKTEALNVTSKNVVIEKGVILHLGDHFIRDDDGVLNIDNILQIDKTKQSVSIDGMVIDKDLVNTIRALQKKVLALEKAAKE